MYPFKSKLHDRSLHGCARIVKASALSVLLLLAGIPDVSAGTTRAQNLKITLNVANTTVKEAIGRIEKTDGYVFVYSNDVQPELDSQVSLRASNRDIDEVLSLLFAKTNVAYKRSGRQITLFRKADKTGHDGRSSLPAPTTPQQPDKHVVKGKVVDSHGEPVVGATVRVNGKSAATVTDIDGNFSIDMEDGKALEISYIGYQPQLVKSPGRQVTINLREDSEILSEVVVIGYGSVKKNDLTGSVSAIKPDEMVKGVQTTAQDALQGKIAGVNIISNSGAPGSASTIRIRSGASLSASNDPLIVIDGVPIDNSSIEGGGNVIGGINPNDIESFTVLKDASATAIYGSRASNGVIVITTKKGSDSGLKFNYSGNFSTSTIAKKLEVLTADEFLKFVPTVTGVPAGVKFGDAHTDWQDEIYRTALGYSHNISVSGNLKKMAPYRISVGYTHQDGIIRTNNYKRFTADGSIAPQFFDKHLTVTLNAKYSNERNRLIDPSVVNNAMRYDPTRPVHAGVATDPGLGYFIWMNGTSPMAIQTDNPVAQLELQDFRNSVNRSIGNMAIHYKLHGFEDLQFNLNLGYDVLKSTYRRDVPEKAGTMYTSWKKDGTGQDYDGTQKKRNYLLDFYANYQHVFAAKHDFSVMAGYGWQHFWKKFNDTSLAPDGSEVFAPTHYETEYYLLSLYGRANYTYDNKYLLTATLRADASSRFAKNNRWGYFPSVALGWRLSEEQFMKRQRVLSNLKLRLSYGQTGQQDIINDYPYMTTFTVSYDSSSYLFGNTWYHTYRPNGYDTDIKWESTATWNAGFDYGFLNNRIYGSVDVYKRHTKDLLNTINVISGTNYAAVLTTNIGEMDNKGLEFSVNAIPVQTKDLSWDLGLNLTWNTSKITKLNTIDNASNFVQTGAISGTGKYVQCFMVGKRPYTFYLAQQAYDSSGNPISGQQRLVQRVSPRHRQERAAQILSGLQHSSEL